MSMLTTEYKNNYSDLINQDPRFINFMALQKQGEDTNEFEFFPSNLSVEKINELRKRIKPAYWDNRKLTSIDDTNLDSKTVSFLWDIKPAEQVENPDYVGCFITFHGCSSSVFFKPSIYEVLSQLPKKIENMHHDHKLYFITDIVNTGHLYNWHQVAVTQIFV